MSAGTDTAQTANQADDNTGRSPYDDYARAAGAVVLTIGTRDETHGDPEAFGATFARFLNAYLAPVVASGRALGPADAFVVLDLMKSARIAVGGHHPDHYRDKAGYGLLGMVHVQRAFSAVQAARPAAPATPQAPEAPEAAPGPQGEPYTYSGPPLVLAEGEVWPMVGAPLRPVESVDGRFLGHFRMDGTFCPAPQDEPYQRPTAAETVDALKRRNVELAATDQDDDDADLIRWALDPDFNPLADLVDLDGDPRPGVTPEVVQARRERLARLLRAYTPRPGEEAALTAAVTKYSLAAMA